MASSISSEVEKKGVLRNTIKNDGSDYHFSDDARTVFWKAMLTVANMVAVKNSWNLGSQMVHSQAHSSVMAEMHNSDKFKDAKTRAGADDQGKDNELALLKQKMQSMKEAMSEMEKHMEALNVKHITEQKFGGDFD